MFMKACLCSMIAWFFYNQSKPRQEYSASDLLMHTWPCSSQLFFWYASHWRVLAIFGAHDTSDGTPFQLPSFEGKMQRCVVANDSYHTSHGNPWMCSSAAYRHSHQCVRHFLWHSILAAVCQSTIQGLIVAYMDLTLLRTIIFEWRVVATTGAVCGCDDVSLGTPCQ